MSEEWRPSLIWSMRLSFVYILITILSWIILRLNLISLFLTIIAFYVIFSLKQNFDLLEKSLTVFSTSIETKNRKHQEIIVYDDIISIKLQFQEDLVGFYVLHPIDFVYSALRYLSSRPKQPHTLLAYEIETEEYMFVDIIDKVDYKEVNTLITNLVKFCGIKPLSRDYSTPQGRGTVFYLSFRDHHSDLDPNVARDLV